MASEEERERHSRRRKRDRLAKQKKEYTPKTPDLVKEFYKRERIHVRDIYKEQDFDYE